MPVKKSVVEPKATSERITLKGEKRARVVYVGARGGKYVRMDGKLVPLDKPKRAERKSKMSGGFINNKDLSDQINNVDQKITRVQNLIVEKFYIIKASLDSLQKPTTTHPSVNVRAQNPVYNPPPAYKQNPNTSQSKNYDQIARDYVQKLYPVNWGQGDETQMEAAYEKAMDALRRTGKLPNASTQRTANANKQTTSRHRTTSEPYDYWKDRSFG